MAKTKLTGRKRDERITAYAFTAPAVILLIAFLVVPMIYTVYYSGFKYQIMSIPTLVVMKYGLFQNRAVGLQTREEIIDMIEQIKED